MASLGFAPRSQWRDRAGLSPASLFGPDGVCRLRRDHLEASYPVAAVSYPAAHARAKVQVVHASRLCLHFAMRSSVRVRIFTLVLATALTACARAPITPPVAHDSLTIRPIDAKSSPSPLVQVQVGSVRGVFPKDWKAQPLPAGLLSQQGFEASPSIAGWERGEFGVQGMEAFWVDIDKLSIPSDYYYLAARSATFDRLGRDKHCSAPQSDVIVNHPPDFTGTTFSASDFVASARGSCVAGDGTITRWAYVVAAPGFGPTRQVGIPTSGLYVVMAEVTGLHAESLMKAILSGATFGDTTVPQLVAAAGRGQN